MSKSSLNQKFDPHINSIIKSKLVLFVINIDNAIAPSNATNFVTAYCCLKAHYQLIAQLLSKFCDLPTKVQALKVKQDLEAVEQLLNALITSLSNDTTDISVASKTLINEFFQYLVDHRDTLASLDRNGVQVTDYKIYSVFNYGVYLFDNCSCKLQPDYLKELVLTNNVALNEPLLLRAWAITLNNPELFRVDLETGGLTNLATLPQDGRRYLACDFVNGTYYVASVDNNRTDGKLQTISANGVVTLVKNLADSGGPNPDGVFPISLQHDLKNNTTYYIGVPSITNFTDSQYTLNLSNNNFMLNCGLTPASIIGVSLVIDSTGKAYFLVIGSTSTDAGKLYDYNLTNSMLTNPRPIVDKNGSPIDILGAQESDFSCGSNGKLYGMLRLSDDTTKFGTIEIKPDKAVFTEIADFPYILYAFAIDC